MGKRLGIPETDRNAWYSVTPSRILQIKDRSLQKLARLPLSKLLKDAYPDHKWETNKFEYILERRRKAIRELEKKLGFSDDDLTNWYKYETKDIIEIGGAGLLQQYGKNKLRMLQSLYPDHHWDVSRFPRKPQNFWDSETSRKEYILRLGKEIGIEPGDYEAWYKVKSTDLLPFGAGTFLHLYKNSMAHMLVSLFPEHEWDLAKLGVKPKGYWESPETQRSFVLDLGKKLGFKDGDLEAYYRLKRSDIIKSGGSGLLAAFGGSPRNLIRSVFPDHEWLPWKFIFARNDEFWADPGTQAAAVGHIEKKLNLREKNDWYRVQRRDLKNMGLESVLRTEAVLVKLLSNVYPDHEWEAAMFSWRTKQRGPIE